MHDCPGGCGTQVPYHQLACKLCWGRLPRVLRDDINDQWRLRRLRRPNRHAQAIRAASLWYRRNPIDT